MAVACLYWTFALGVTAGWQYLTENYQWREGRPAMLTQHNTDTCRVFDKSAIDFFPLHPFRSCFLQERVIHGECHPVGFIKSTIVIVHVEYVSFIDGPILVKHGGL